ncbi:LysM peptidoglycan-binding domain-containing protein [Nesterenkonia salmonea]|uniref:LysM peptidoglycan-binding domain-containing protein n=1 Tax=Nesterenkonia salmonea TaxID=1804987 RepID=A0A5R9BA35_9MICC|nr:transglycosylase family protein [Nesterenkonia salmonea]TLP96387.1 LysM peptidoglycan-binding domain-containing protein [Nesterenkonia salmonea]
MKTTPTWKKFVGGSVAAAALAGGAVVAQAPVANAQSDWDRLAECESGGNWSINTGNGYYGGLQFSQQSWQAVGGSGLPSDASKQEQIQRAHQLWEIQGWGAWPACSAKLGLSGSPSGGGGSAPAPEPTPEQTQEAPQEQAPQQEAPQQTEQAPAPQPEPEAPQQTEQAPQQQAPQTAGEFSAQPNTNVEVSGETYTIQSGDTLSSIADALDLDWTDIWGANIDQVEDPNLIFVGDELKLPVVSG